MPRSEPSSGIVRWGDAPATSSSDECPEGGDGSEDCPYELDEIEPTSDPDDPDGCDPEEEICDPCGDERDVMIQE